MTDPDAEPRSPDTIYLLTDGRPTQGRIRSIPVLLEYIAERNRDLHLRIHLGMCSAKHQQHFELVQDS